METMGKELYLDHHATTPVDPRVLEVMLPYFTQHFGNPASSNHSYGWVAEQAVEKAREQVAELVKAKSKEIIFTSGATESINLAIMGILRQYEPGAAHLITSNTEHKATLETAQAAQAMGYKVSFLPVDRYGQVHLDQVREVVTDKTVLVSLIFANNEIGTINPIAEIGEFLSSKNILLHVDAAQAAGKVAIDVERMGIHLLSLSGHKIYGPKGVGALYIRGKNPRVRLKPLLTGGSQEHGIRPGTVNATGAIGIGKACEIMSLEGFSENSRLTSLRDKMWSMLQEKFSEISLNGHPKHRLGHNLNVSFKNVHPDLFLANIKGLAISSGSACSTGSTNPSHVLTAIGVNPELCRTTLRFGLGKSTQEEDIRKAIDIVYGSYQKSRKG